MFGNEKKEKFSCHYLWPAIWANTQIKWNQGKPVNTGKYVCTRLSRFTYLSIENYHHPLQYRSKVSGHIIRSFIDMKLAQRDTNTIYRILNDNCTCLLYKCFKNDIFQILVNVQTNIGTNVRTEVVDLYESFR